MAHGQHLGGYPCAPRSRLDPNRHGVAMGELVEPGMHGVLQTQCECRPADLIRMAAEVQEEFDPEQGSEGQATGALYIRHLISGPWWAALAGLMPKWPCWPMPWATSPWWVFAGGEIARHHLFSYTGILTVWS